MCNMKIDQLIRSSRKTVAIIIQRDGKVIVRAPEHMPEKAIQRFVNRKSGWIKEKLGQVQERQAQAAPKTFIDGETFLYLGQSYPLVLVGRQHPPLLLSDGCFHLAQTAHPQARQFFQAWYKKQAREVLTQQVQLYAGRYQLSYSKIRISSAKTLWGSCSANNTLSFTWRLIMAPLPIIDYVVVHELAHFTEKNHSKQFWARVETMLPDYKARLKWLKTNGHLLNLT